MGMRHNIGYGHKNRLWLLFQTTSSCLVLVNTYFSLVLGAHFFLLKCFLSLIYFFIFFAFYKLCLGVIFIKKSFYYLLCLFFIIPAASISSFLISTDLLLLLFWTLAMTKLLKIRKYQSTISFILLGGLLGLAFLIQICCYVFSFKFFNIILHRQKHLLVYKKQSWLLCFCFSDVLVVFPNIYWNFNNGWVTFSHTADNANLQNLDLNFYEPLKFLIHKFLCWVLVLFLSFFYMFRSFRLDFENKFC